MSGHFAPTYFAPSYFAGTYFAPGQGAPAVLPRPVIVRVWDRGIAVAMASVTAPGPTIGATAAQTATTEYQALRLTLASRAGDLAASAGGVDVALESTSDGPVVGSQPTGRVSLATRHTKASATRRPRAKVEVDDHD